MAKNKISLYLGKDGEYVLSKTALALEYNPDCDGSWDGMYLTPAAGKRCTSLEEYSGDCIFKELGLRKHEVVRLDIKVVRLTRAAAKKSAAKAKGKKRKVSR